MTAPNFKDLGKSARDVFTSGYHYGKTLIKLGVKAKSDILDMGSDLRLICDTSKLTGTMDSQYKTNYGNFLQKWTTDNTVTLGHSIDDLLIPDVGVQSEISYNPTTTAKLLKIGTKCSKELFSASCSISSDIQFNVDVLGSVVAAIKGFLIGYQGGYNSGTNKMTKNDLSMAFDYQDFGFYFRCTSIPYEYGLSLMYKVTEEWDTAVNSIVCRNGGMIQWMVGAAAKWKIDDTSTFRFKFNSDLQLGMSLQQKLDDNVMLTLSFNIDCINPLRGGHKVGLALDIEG
ncbi:voltage-dependent anion-selective channel protein 1-like [Apis florea]|uniref:voltage-dependent anion-selective channel protein 1-like n=1 Tax=Apis florea TaxID=7463 RepID=UPI000629D155|nr:voltage-dependent anion-selective channel protein 1-like [Apis florea]